MSRATTNQASPAVRWSVILVLAALALFASYRVAVARGTSTQSTTSNAVASAPIAAGSGTRGTATRAAGGCACCGGSAAASQAAPTKGTADVASGVQRISVDLSKGYYDPSEIHLKAGVPAEITFGQSSGCTGQVISSDLGFSEDLTTGPKTVKLPALQAGTFSFSCGMQMVFGSIVVE